MSTMKSSSNDRRERKSKKIDHLSTLAGRSLALDEHIKLVKQKKEEAEVLRLQRFQEQLKKKEQKWSRLTFPLSLFLSPIFCFSGNNNN